MLLALDAIAALMIAGARCCDMRVFAKFYAETENENDPFYNPVIR